MILLLQNEEALAFTVRPLRTDYKNDPDALNNLTGDEEHAKLENRYREELLKVMQKTKDHQTDRYQKSSQGRLQNHWAAP